MQHCGISSLIRSLFHSLLLIPDNPREVVLMNPFSFTHLSDSQETVQDCKALFTHFNQLKEATE